MDHSILTVIFWESRTNVSWFNFYSITLIIQP